MRRFDEMSRLDGRVALVTGAGGHLGTAACEVLAELGCGIALMEKDAGSLRTVARHMEGFEVPLVPLCVDLSDEMSIRAAVDDTTAALGRLDILIHTAALVGTSELGGWAVPFEEQTVDAWQRAMEINLTSAFVLAQASAPHLRTHGCGAIVLIGSIYGKVGPDLSLYAETEMASPAAYAASKGGLAQLTRWLATVLAPDVRVNSISPGGIARGQEEIFVRRYEQRTPLRRLATEEDMKGAIAYLASDLSSYVTGHDLSVDGGWTVW